MKLDIVEATREDAAVVDRLLQFYQYDFSEILGGDTAPDGVYRYVSAEGLWDDPDAHIFIARVDDRPAGFAVVLERSHFTGDPDVRYMDEFFVMRKYRRNGVGTRLATHLFETFPGKWEVAEVQPNTNALAFWRSAIGAYTNGKFDERVEDSDLWQGPVQTFDTRTRVGAGGTA